MKPTCVAELTSGPDVNVSSNSARSRDLLVAGKYRLIRTLGVGGMGEVFEAEHIFTKRRVALKLVAGSLARSVPAMAERFFAEAEAAASIAHPGIVDVLDAGCEEDGTLYLALELLEGQDLESAIRRDRLRPADLVRVGVRLLEALAATHASGYIHRDVKPANIFLARSVYGAVQVKVLDFGIAKRTDPKGKTDPDRGTVVGTIEYMSPEQAQGAPLDSRSDLFSVGAVLFRGLAGRPPFLGGDFHRTVLQITTERAPSLRSFRSDLPDDLVTVIDRALERDVADRWQTAEDMAQALAHCDHARLYSCENFTETADLAELVHDEATPVSQLAPVHGDFPNISVEATTAKYAVMPFVDDDAPQRPRLHSPTVKVRRRADSVAGPDTDSATL